MNIPYEKSLVAQNLASTYIRVFGRLLDWSSINCSGSFIFKTLFAENETLIAMLDFLSMKTKNQPFCLKDEANGGKLKTIIASSAKVSFPYIDLFFQIAIYAARCQIQETRDSISHFLGSSIRRSVSPSVRPSIFWGFPLLPTSPVLIPSYIQPCYFCILLYQQYIITEFHIDATFPLTPFSESAVIFKKIKGVPRSRQHLCNFLDFENVTVYNKPTKSVITASLKKKTFQIFFIKGKKRTISNFSTKRLYSEKYKIFKKSYFSFPLNWKGRIIR